MNEACCASQSTALLASIWWVVRVWSKVGFLLLSYKPSIGVVCDISEIVGDSYTNPCIFASLLPCLLEM